MPSLLAILQETVNISGAAAGAEHLQRLAAALAALYPDAFRLGLTNYPDPQEFTRQLVCPLLTLLTPIALPHLAAPALDFGAGSGAVGLSLAILRPELEVVLADRRSRVIQFLDLSLRRLRVDNCRALQVDLAAPPADWRQRCGLVLIRAFGPTAEALRHADGLRSPDGAIALWHQPPPPPPPAHLRAVLTLPTSVAALDLTIYSGQAPPAASRSLPPPDPEPRPPVA